MAPFPNLKLKQLTPSAESQGLRALFFALHLINFLLLPNNLKSRESGWLVGSCLNYNNAPLGFGLLMASANWQDKRLQLLARNWSEAMTAFEFELVIE